ncbi:hypothetical protein F5H01DRAFT_293215, partial [Linnemannia elongata]
SLSLTSVCSHLFIPPFVCLQPSAPSPRHRKKNEDKRVHLYTYTSPSSEFEYFTLPSPPLSPSHSNAHTLITYTNTFNRGRTIVYAQITHC